ncbi:hypothetical protein [Caballeronia ptereochthonis]|uniref:hypothetical protein n=1 Tax=Caballeronia ptereochthonis TaxID=1777144 RepID=UPI00117CFE5C|nr:hypothetical protein [Caballeronia ptereochthonis]
MNGEHIPHFLTVAWRTKWEDQKIAVEMACSSENVLFVAELLNWRVEKPVLHARPPGRATATKVTKVYRLPRPTNGGSGIPHLLADTADHTNDLCTLEAAVAVAQGRRGEVGRQGKCDRGASKSQFGFYRTVAIGHERPIAFV